jgi:hypothetical protein
MHYFQIHTLVDADPFRNVMLSSYLSTPYLKPLELFYELRNVIKQM